MTEEIQSAPMAEEQSEHTNDDFYFNLDVDDWDILRDTNQVTTHLYVVLTKELEDETVIKSSSIKINIPENLRTNAVKGMSQFDESTVEWIKLITQHEKYIDLINELKAQI